MAITGMKTKNGTAGRGARDMSMETLRALYVHDIGELYRAENLQLEVLPRWLDRCSDPDLQRAFEKSAALTRRHGQRLDKLFDAMSYRPDGLRCRDMERLLARAADALTIPNRKARDKELIETARRIERWQIASYHAAVRIAELLGERGACTALRHSLEEETRTGRLFDRLATTRSEQPAPGLPATGRAQVAGPAAYFSLMVH